MTRQQPPQNAYLALLEFIRQHPRLLILTRAGMSTDSGIPDAPEQQGQRQEQRQRQGKRKHKRPVLHGDLMTSERVRLSAQY